MAFCQTGWGSSFQPFQFERDRFLHALEVVPNVPVGKAHDANAAFIEKLRPSRILHGSTVVLIAVNLDRQMRGGAVEVEDIRTDRVLPAKRHAKLCTAEHVPELQLYR